MKAHPEWRMAVEGHTDVQGALDYNRLLSERRAQAVKAHLQSAGIAPERLTAVGFGASRPLAAGGSSGTILNRRADLRRL
jgi:OmpA-OmpF porin, OOP family